MKTLNKINYLTGLLKFIFIVCSFDINIIKNLNEGEIDVYLLQFEKIVRKLRDGRVYSWRQKVFNLSQSKRRDLYIYSILNRGYKLIECENDNEEIISKIKNPHKNNIELLYVRASSLIGAFNRGLPLEDLSIGFQIKMFRIPNVYNFKFWLIFKI